MRLALVLVFAALAGCAIPQTNGARGATEHYDIRTDGRDAAWPGHVGKAAEAVHASLETQFGERVSGSFPLVVFADRAAFDKALAPELRQRGFVGECTRDYALISWPDDQRGQDTLAHELVHHFVNELVPDLPYWADEGLAKALAPKRAASATEWLSLVNDLSGSELRRHFLSLEALPGGPDYRLRCMVAAAVVRFGLETEGMQDLRGLARWKPDQGRFVAWLRSRRWVPFRRFHPLLDAPD